MIFKFMKSFVKKRKSPLKFELVSQLLNNNNNNSILYFNNFHEFHFLKHDEERCFKVTCRLISHSSIVRFLNKNVHGIETKQNEDLQQEFSNSQREYLEFHLKQFLIHYLTSK